MKDNSEDLISYEYRNLRAYAFQEYRRIQIDCYTRFCTLCSTSPIREAIFWPGDSTVATDARHPRERGQPARGWLRPHCDMSHVGVKAKTRSLAKEVVIEGLDVTGRCLRNGHTGLWIRDLLTKEIPE